MGVWWQQTQVVQFFELHLIWTLEIELEPRGDDDVIRIGKILIGS